MNISFIELLYFHNYKKNYATILTSDICDYGVGIRIGA